ncbi:ferric reductase like transmembrane component-domain-containing protein [Fomitopsis serialis]|uniref:ferric reductase like transmembrane component-domain-containing protein n=1 Tax=Fomitopsis serialis TaxID=139415 RepID=UPI002008D494|nr:ferric reductase like transmembrane component-domain-containing protein [Neoantrodia serialis]KAH9935370.1 ferric reductase like transmembrane component-domain-containing protein [Neoantrodia serialis]
MSYNAAQTTTAAAGSAAATFSVDAYDATSGGTDLLTGDLYFLADVLLLCVAALFFLLALPRAITRLTRLSAWTEGLFLRAGSGRRRVQHPGSLSPKEGEVYDYSERSFAARRFTSQRRVNPTSGSPTTVTDDGDSDAARSHRRPPAHMPAWSSIFPGMSARLGATLRPGHSVGSALLLLGYAVLMLFVGLEGGNPFVEYVPAGWVAASQLPVVFILGTKNNLLGVLLGKGYEKLNYLHRFVGRFVFLAANVHSLGYLYQWSIQGTLAQNLTPNIIWGFVALVCADILFFLSLHELREVLYPLFYFSHVLAAIIILPATALHERSTTPYVITALVLYLFDRLLRIAQTRLTHAHPRALPVLGTVRLTLPTLSTGWRAGQHVRVKVLSTGMGWWGWAESHPFTVASCAEDGGRGSEGEGLVLLCKSAGKWGERLMELARRAEYCEAGGGSPRVRVLVDGPFGGPGHAVIASYSAALLVAGGSGISYPLAIAEELLRDASYGASRVRLINLVWSVQDTASLDPILPQFTRLLRTARHTGTHLRISLFHTRATTSTEPKLSPSARFLPQGLTVRAGRPPLASLLSSVVNRTLEVHKASVAWTPQAGSGEAQERRSPSGVFVGVCGPRALGEDVERLVRTFGAREERAGSVGGVECQVEVFGW